MPVLKRNKNSVRISGDYVVTANKASKLVLPNTQIGAALAGGIIYTKLDMSQAYQQMELDELR